MQRVLVALQ